MNYAPLSRRNEIMRPSTIRKPELSHCASLSTQHVRLSGVRLCWPDSLELVAWWTQKFWQFW